jgi:hypothetical protein
LALTSKQKRAPPADSTKPMVRWLSASGTGMGAAAAPPVVVLGCARVRHFFRRQSAVLLLLLVPLPHQKNSWSPFFSP